MDKMSKKKEEALQRPGSQCVHLKNLHFIETLKMKKCDNFESNDILVHT